MNAGRLRHRVVIQSVSQSNDSYGDPIETWTNAATRWASDEPLSGEEFFAAQQVESATTRMLKMRHYKPLTNENRILSPRTNTTVGQVQSSGTTTLQVSSAAGFPPTGKFIVRVEDELQLVTAGHGTTTWTVTRGQFGTSGVQHAGGTDVTLMVILHIGHIINPREIDQLQEIHCNEVEYAIG